MCEELFCAECGHEMMIDGSGVSHHLTEECEIDYDQDADHVAIMDEE